MFVSRVTFNCHYEIFQTPQNCLPIGIGVVMLSFENLSCTLQDWKP